MKQAAVMLVVRDGLILAVSRKDDKTKFGLPGGKTSEGELPQQTAIRETLEETGIEVHGGMFIFKREEPAPIEGGEPFYAFAFYATNWLGEPKSVEGTEVKWLTVKELTSKETGAFPEYNAKTIEAFKKLYPRVELKDAKTEQGS
jgi:8-oxo-dGTP diphosphatase